MCLSNSRPPKIAVDIDICKHNPLSIFEIANIIFPHAIYWRYSWVVNIYYVNNWAVRTAGTVEKNNVKKSPPKRIGDNSWART
jgi:hypothetical protein